VRVMNKPRSLQNRMLATVLGLVLLIWLTICAAIWFDARHELDELLDAHLAQAAALLVMRQQQGGELEHHDSTDAASLHRYAPKVAFQVFHEGRLSLRSSNAPAAPMLGLRDVGRHAGFHSLDLDGQRWRVFASRGAEHDVQVFVGEQLDARADILMGVLRGALWPMLLGLPLLALLLVWAIRRGLAPLRELGHSLRQRSPLSLQPVTLSDAPAELSPPLQALNVLFERIATLLEAERRFTADAAHELRTPIAAIRTQAQVALGETDDLLRRHALEATLQGCDRATRLVEQMLTLARLEADQRPMTARVELATLARRVLAELAPQALAREQDLSLTAPEGCHVAGNDTLLAVLLRNLVDNALRYSPAGARIEVRLSAQGEGVRLQVADSGPGLAEADLARLGERFFRVLGTGAAGSGLGWSIVRRIASAHGARLHCASSTGLGGLEVSVDLPQAVASPEASRVGASSR